MFRKTFKSRINSLDNYGAGVLSIRVNDTIKDANVEKVVNDTTYSNFLSVNEKYQEALAPDAIKSLNEQTKQLQTNRRQAFLDIYDYTEGLTKSPDEKEAKAAIAIFKILDLYGRGFVYQKLTHQTICYFRILEQLTKPEYAENLATINLTQAVANFDSLQKSYEKSYMDWGDALTGNTVPSKLRKDLDLSLKLLFDFIRTQAITSKDEALTTLFSNLLARLDEVDTARRKRKKEDDENNSDAENEDETTSDKEA